MAVESLDHVNLRAAEPRLTELLRFYVDVVGLTAGPRPPFAVFGYWLYAGMHPVLHLAEGASTSSATGTISHVAFRCTDAAVHEDRLRSAGIAYRSTKVPATGVRQFFFTDPSGNGVELQFD